MTMQQSLGLIEVVGLTNAIEAADAAVKSANVDLKGYEITKGGGLVLVKVVGEVGAVKAAVESAINAVTRKNGKVYAHKVIARMGNDIDRIVFPNIAKASENLPVAQQDIPVKNVAESIDECASCVDLAESFEATPPTKSQKKPVKVSK